MATENTEEPIEEGEEGPTFEDLEEDEAIDPDETLEWTLPPDFKPPGGLLSPLWGCSI